MSIQQIFFLLVVMAVGYLGYQAYRKIWYSINLGKAYSGAPLVKRRLKHLFLVAFGQGKMFGKPVSAVLHLCIYIAFLLTQIELIEILIDGVFGSHRFFAPSLGIFYTLIINTIELLSLLAFIATVIFLWRRNVRKVKRFEKPELTGWPKTDANLILIGEILLILGIFTMNGADLQLQHLENIHFPDTGPLVISSALAPVLFAGVDENLLLILERSGWWLHVLVVFGFLLYLPKSKHLHIMLAFPNTFYARQQTSGSMNNMPEIMQEVKNMLGITADTGASVADIPEFGAKDVKHLTWKNLLDAYTCTECGRCTAVCPANLTGKKLSPRKVMMDVRDRADEVTNKLISGDKRWIREDAKTSGVLTRENFEDGKSLFDYISAEEIHACTTCQACIEACPVLINPLEIILEMRRYEILTLATGPQEWLPMFNSLENNGAVWQVHAERDAWIAS